MNVMTPPHNTSRRTILAALGALPIGAAAGAFANDSHAQPSTSKVLVAYFSRTGNTRVIARQIQRARNADLFEILPVTPYPEDYEQTVAQSQRERDSNFEPALQDRVTNISHYDTVFLGFPIWSQTAPPVIRSFLSAHDLTGKTLIPFITHGGYGLGNSLSVVARHAPGARVADKALSMEADQERRTLDQVTKWLQGK
ncbi:twin-arginine translocation pathway signal [Acidovorax delafieldii 2AN]|uniref:Twin-arginine translocation pathway signal n=2 Tax=Acidovorax delafieldii TaxID=47920 RepID=C5T3B0_ACIDE|nr:twin-arginine translocation pathway signal [Acidovorax delafieldii 2AN]